MLFIVRDHVCRSRSFLPTKCSFFSVWANAHTEERQDYMAEERHPNNGRGWLVLIVIVMIMIILFVKSNSPLGFLGWFTSVLLGITLAVVIPIGSFLLICAVIRRFAERRQREAEQETEMPEQHQPASLRQPPRPTYQARQQPPPRPPTHWEDNGC